LRSEEKIVQRWKKPVTALAVDDTFEWATSDLGRATLDYKARFSPEQIERFRLGYICLECWEPHESPFPEKCILCGYEMRARQNEDFARKFQGVERDPRAKLIETELDALDDKHERNYYETNSGIVIPKGI
jgi:hypothetical protein